MLMPKSKLTIVLERIFPGQMVKQMDVLYRREQEIILRVDFLAKKEDLTALNEAMEDELSFANKG